VKFLFHPVIMLTPSSNFDESSASPYKSKNAAPPYKK